MPLGLNPNTEPQVGGLGSAPSPNTSGQVVAGSGTITLPTAGFTCSVAPAGAVTGVILTQGQFDGQMIVIFNTATGANSITFAAAATSNVADGTSSVIAGLNAAIFVWSALAARWYKVKS